MKRINESSGLLLDLRDCIYKPLDTSGYSHEFSMDLRTVFPYSEMGWSNHQIEDNLRQAGLINEDENCLFTDTEFSQFFIYFGSVEQATYWVNELYQYVNWLADNIRLPVLADRYKKVNRKRT